MKRFWLLILAAPLLGCGGNEPSPSERSSAPAEAVAPPPPPPLTTASAPEATQPAPTVRQKAEVGVGAKGRGYGSGPVATPVATLFSVKERLVFDVQIPEAMKLFKATEGRAPRTQNEFMEKIIKEGQIRLPELPAGCRYVYDPKEEQLTVEQPARGN